MNNSKKNASRYIHTTICLLLCYLTFSSCEGRRYTRSESHKYFDDTLLVITNEIKIVDSAVAKIMDSLIYNFNFCRMDKGKLQVYIVVDDLVQRSNTTGQAFDIYITNNADYPKPKTIKTEYYGGMVYKDVYVLYNSHFITQDYAEISSRNYKWYELTGGKITIPVFNRTVSWLNHNMITEQYDIINGKFKFQRRIPCNDGRF